MEQKENGSAEPIITIRASLKKLAALLDSGKNCEIRVFVVEKEKSQKLDAGQHTLDEFPR